MDSKGSSIKIGVGLGFMATAVITAIIGTIKAEEKLAELDEDATSMDKVKKLIPVAAPTVISFAIGTGCIISGHKQDLKQIAIVTSAFEASQFKQRELTEYIRKHMGEKAERELKEAFHEEKSKEAMPEGPKDPNIVSSGHGDSLFYDSGTGRFFRADVAWLERCRLEISHRIFTDEYASANELADLLNLPCTVFGNLLGWNTSDLDSSTKEIDMRWTYCSMSDWGEPYGILEYDVHERFKL